MLDHDNILKVLDDFETEKYFCLVLPICDNGILKEWVYKHGGLLLEDEVRELRSQTAAGLVHLHQEFIAHGDVHLGNFLLTSDMQIKISDFGQSMIDSNEERDRDVWCFGRALFKLLTGKNLEFHSIDQLSIKENKGNLSEDAIRIIKECMAKKKGKRPTFARLAKDSFFKLSTSSLVTETETGPKKHSLDKTTPQTGSSSPTARKRTKIEGKNASDLSTGNTTKGDSVDLSKRNTSAMDTEKDADFPVAIIPVTNTMGQQDTISTSAHADLADDVVTSPTTTTATFAIFPVVVVTGTSTTSHVVDTTGTNTVATTTDAVTALHVRDETKAHKATKAHKETKAHNETITSTAALASEDDQVL
ncbi:hypothetical protein BGX23_006154 [Mortierella sp. AD031]|nr:hypothetical protein BGX23_006154 [Mortierella sp. AD031]